MSTCGGDAPSSTRPSSCLWSLAFCVAMLVITGRSQDFVVEGTVTHSQFGHLPREESWRFSARTEGESWSASVLPTRESHWSQIMAIGNPRGVFVIMEFSPALRGRTVNTSQALVMSNTVPTSLLAPEVGPIWLVYLSRNYMEQPPRRIPPPVPFNVAGGASLPNFEPYSLEAHWEYDPTTRFIRRLVTLDDGKERALLGGKLVEVGTYPPPFNKGFTNLVFEVLSHEKYEGQMFPKKSQLDVFWVSGGKREMVHRYIIEATRFRTPPSTSIPEPELNGIGAISDGRLSHSKNPVVVPYLATNRFLTPEEIMNLPAFKQALMQATTFQPTVLPAAQGPTERRLFVLCILFLATLVFVFLAFKLSKQGKKA
jgi:hypothetical protein